MNTKCYTCWRKTENCLCPKIKPFKPNTKIIILMHPMEAKKERLGTGRLTKAILENSKIIVDIDFTHNEEVNSIISDPNNEVWCLYPGTQAIDLSSCKKEIFDENKTRVVFVIDGTWPCAKKMMRLSSNLQALPKLAFNPDKISRFVIKEQPHELCWSTIESVHEVLSCFENLNLENLANAHHNLIEVLGHLVQFQIDCALDPHRPSYRHQKIGYTKVEERQKSKKWLKRKIF